MKTRNFPGRKNARRMVALEGLYDRLYYLLENPNSFRAPKLPGIQAEIDALEGRVVDPETARDIRTKKYRGDQARVK